MPEGGKSKPCDKQTGTAGNVLKSRGGQKDHKGVTGKSKLAKFEDHTPKRAPNVARTIFHN